MLDRGNRGVGTDDIGPGHVVYCVEGAWEGSLQGNDVLDHGCGRRGSHFADFTLRAGFGLVVTVWETWVFRVGRGCNCVVVGFVH